jgi:hypothetical protein
MELLMHVKNYSGLTAIIRFDFVFLDHSFRVVSRRTVSSYSITGLINLKYACLLDVYKSVSKSFRTGRVERELQMIQLSATRCSSIAIL